MIRFNRNYKITITTDTETIEIRPPMRITFDIERTISSYGRISLQLYNLNSKHRDALIYQIVNDGPFIDIALDVGYGYSDDDLYPAFRGQVTSGTVSRDGPEIVNSLDALDGGVGVVAFTNKTIKEHESVITAALADIKKVTRGKVGGENVSVRASVIHGNSFMAIVEATRPRKVFIRDGKLHALTSLEFDDVLYVPEVSSDTGLLNVPAYEPLKVICETLFNPRVLCGGVFDLKSKINPRWNGLYKCYTLSVSGDTHGDEWKQTITGFANKDLVPV